MIPEKYMLKFHLLFNQLVSGVEDITEEMLIDILKRGEGIYWQLEWDDDHENIKVMQPYSIEQVIENLKPPKLDDIFYDFNERL